MAKSNFDFETDYLLQMMSSSSAKIYIIKPHTYNICLETLHYTMVIQTANNSQVSFFWTNVIIDTCVFLTAMCKMSSVRKGTLSL